MDVKSFRASSMQEALNLVRADLGPDAAVLHTRDLGGGLLRWLWGGRQIEVLASNTVEVPSKFDEIAHKSNDESSTLAGQRGEAARELRPTNRLDAAIAQGATDRHDSPTYTTGGVDSFDHRHRYRDDMKSQLADLQAMVQSLQEQRKENRQGEVPSSLFGIYTDLIEAEVAEDIARDLVARVQSSDVTQEVDPVLLKARMARMVEQEIRVGGPIHVTPGTRRLVALVGPTGVGKTTTIAKLAANFRLREKRQVGLITVDTYRIAAVEQLRTYADIIDLPMEVVSTPKEMREAVERMSHLDLVLLDTAGRSPKDDVKIQELKSMLAEAKPDEVHLVLSSVAGSQTMVKTATRFAEVGLTNLLLTKLDEATGLGGLLPLLRACDVPLSYLTNGQNVPDDIQPAQREPLTRLMLGME